MLRFATQTAGTSLRIRPKPVERRKADSTGALPCPLERCWQPELLYNIDNVETKCVGWGKPIGGERVMQWRRRSVGEGKVGGRELLDHKLEEGVAPAAVSWRELNIWN